MKVGKPCPKHPELKGRRHNGGNCTGCVKESKKAYIANNKPKIREYYREYRAKNLERAKELNTSWRKSNPEKIRNTNLARIGFTVRLVEDAKTLQNGLCAICLVNLESLPKRQVHADHCHTTGEPRGVLCHHCNAGLGAFRDNPDALRRAIEYLANPTLRLL